MVHDTINFKIIGARMLSKMNRELEKSHCLLTLCGQKFDTPGTLVLINETLWT